MDCNMSVCPIPTIRFHFNTTRQNNVPRYAMKFTRFQMMMSILLMGASAFIGHLSKGMFDDHHVCDIPTYLIYIPTILVAISKFTGFYLTWVYARVLEDPRRYFFIRLMTFFYVDTGLVALLTPVVVSLSTHSMEVTCAMIVFGMGVGALVLFIIITCCKSNGTHTSSTTTSSAHHESPSTPHHFGTNPDLDSACDPLEEIGDMAQGGTHDPQGFDAIPPQGFDGVPSCFA